MSQLDRLKTIERKIQMDESLFPKIPNFDGMSEDEINKRYDELVIKIKNKFGLTKDSELKEYFEATKKWYDMYEAGKEKEAAKFIAGYESELMKKKIENPIFIKII